MTDAEEAAGDAPPPACVVCGSPIVLPADETPDGARCPSHRTAPAPPGAATAVPLRMTQPYPVFRINRVIVVNDGPIVSVDDTELVGCRVAGGQALVTLRHFDEHDAPLLEIVENVWRVGDPDRFTLLNGPGSLEVLEWGAPILELGCSSTPLRFNARLVKSGVSVVLRAGSLRLGEEAIAYRSPTVPDDGYAGCIVAIDTARSTAELAPDPRHGGHALTLTEHDPIKRITIALNAMSSLQAHIDAGPLEGQAPEDHEHEGHEH